MADAPAGKTDEDCGSLERQPLAARRVGLAKTAPSPFLGQLCVDDDFTTDALHDDNKKFVADNPDVSPFMTFADQISLRPFRTLGLWKAALIEGVGTMLFTFVSVWASLSPPVPPTVPTAEFGYFANAAYLGPLTAGLSNSLFLTIFIFALSTVSGAHLNPTITFATFCARLCTLPRLVLYVSFQLIGASLGGLLVSAGYGTRHFKTGGCWLFTQYMPARDALAVEFTTCLTLLFFVFGVGLDPGQSRKFPRGLSPFLVGISVGFLGWVSAYSRYGYGGAALNPARCFGTFVGSRFPSWHWVNWVGDFSACLVHGAFYAMAKPSETLFSLSITGKPI